MRIDKVWAEIIAPTMAACVVALGVSALFPTRPYGIAFIAGGIAFLLTRLLLVK